jgi:hypothetical protein
MFAIRLVSSSSVDDLALEKVEIPRPGSGDALVRVQAAAITRDELEWPVDRPLVDEGAVQLAIDSVFRLGEARAAFERVMMRRGHSTAWFSLWRCDRSWTAR